MTIAYVISGTRPNLSIQATDGNGKVVTVSFNTGDTIQTVYNLARQAFITSYSLDPSFNFSCIWTGTGNLRTCHSTDSFNNTITHIIDTRLPVETIRSATIGHFVDLYGMSNDNLLYQYIEDYHG